MQLGCFDTVQAHFRAICQLKSKNSSHFVRGGFRRRHFAQRFRAADSSGKGSAEHCSSLRRNENDYQGRPTLVRITSRAIPFSTRAVAVAGSIRPSYSAGYEAAEKMEVGGVVREQQTPPPTLGAKASASGSWMRLREGRQRDRRIEKYSGVGVSKGSADAQGAPENKSRRVSRPSALAPRELGTHGTTARHARKTVDGRLGQAPYPALKAVVEQWMRCARARGPAAVLPRA